ncbi:MAG: hypothetical protein IJW40_09670 [Clostridia bacterium]|nr:hypothetical protein [Clostridia bacterium]
MKKHILRYAALLLAVLLLISCAASMPDEYKIDDSEEEMIDYGIIDDSLYTPNESMVYSMRLTEFVNLPGMVLLNDQEAHYGGIHLSYVNKANVTEYYFCFDPLCNHHYCMGGYGGDFKWVENWVWSVADDNVYATAEPPEDVDSTAKSDGNLYCIDLDTQEYEMVYEGNGTPISQIYANEDYIFLSRQHKDGYHEIIRYDPIKKKAEKMTPLAGKQFASLMVSGDTILVIFNDNYRTIYQTNNNFSHFVATSLPLQPIYIDQNMMYIAENVNGVSAGWDGSARSICRINIDTEEKETIITYAGDEFSVCVVGYGGGYVYYLLNPIQAGTTTVVSAFGRILYRVPIEGGEPEPMVNFGKEHTGLKYDMNVDQVVVYDGTIYCHLKASNSGYFVDRYGTLTQDQDGVWTFQKLPVGDEEVR